MAWQPAAAASDGKSYEWYRQDATNGCGCASILMMLHLMQNKKLSENTIHQWMNAAEVNQNAVDGVRSFEDKGGKVISYNAVLAKVNIKCSTVKGQENVKKWVVTATAQKPLLAHVFWTTGGGHTVVVVGHTPTHTIVLDPELGVVEIPNPSLNTYAVTYGTVAQTGTIELLTQPL